MKGVCWIVWLFVIGVLNLSLVNAQGRPDIVWMAGGHTNAVNSVAFSPDGQTLASGSLDHMIKLWRVSDGAMIRTLIGHGNTVNSVAFSPDGQTLVSGAWDWTIKLWRVSDGALIRTLSVPGVVNSVAFSPDGQTLASGVNSTIRFWRVSDGALIRTLSGHTDWVNSVAFSPDGQTLASGSADRSIKLWRVSDGSLIRSLTGHTADINSVDFSPDGQTIASGSRDRSIKLWRVSDGSLIRSLTGHTAGINSVDFSPDGQTIASGSSDNRIWVWRVSDGALIRALTWQSSAVLSVAFSPDGQTLASGSHDNTIKIWRMSDGALIWTLWNTGSVSSVAFSPDGQTLASGSWDRSIKLWRVSDGAMLRSLTGHTGSVNSVAFSPDGQTLASGSEDSTIKLWRVSDGALIRSLTWYSFGVLSVAFSPDGQTLASGSGDNTIRIWRVSDGALIRSLTGHTDTVTSVSFSPDGQSLASGSWDYTIKLWRVSDGSLIRSLTGHTNWVNSVAFSPDGETLASGSWDYTIKIWRVGDGALIRTLTGHTDVVNSVAFSPDGQILASGSGDNTIKILRLSDGLILQNYNEETLRVNTIQYSLDGLYLAFGRSDATVVLAYNPNSEINMVPQDDTYTTSEDTTLQVAAPGVLENDTFNLPAAAELVTPPARGTLQLNGNGAFTYTPQPNYCGEDSFTYALRFGSGSLSDPATVTLTITPQPDHPVAMPDQYQVCEDETLSVNAPGVLDNDFDVDSICEEVTLRAVLVVPPAHGSLTLNQNGGFQYTPHANYNGTDEFLYLALDNTGRGSFPVQVLLTVTPVNDPPSFTKGPDITVCEDSAAYQQSSWATNILAGPANESGQAVQFLVSAGDPSLFSVQPTISPEGQLTFTPAPDACGTTTVTVVVRDNGGTNSCGGEDTSAEQTFVITITCVNDPPSFTKGSDITVCEDSAAYQQSSWATNIQAGPANESGQTVQFLVSAGDPSLFSVQPTISPEGQLTFTPAPDACGTTTVTVVVRDNGGTNSCGGEDTSAEQTFVITITCVNDPPSFTKGSDITVCEDSAAYQQSSWATNIQAGPANESGQTVQFLVSAGDPSLFSVQPTISTAGQLTFTPAPDACGTTTVTVVLRDDGGTNSCGGEDTSAEQTFVITITCVNDPPSFTGGGNVTVPEDAGLREIAHWATNIRSGPPNESSQTLQFVVEVECPNCFELLPTIDSETGTLRFQLAADWCSSTEVTVRLRDDGGVNSCGGVDTSEPFTFTITATPVNDCPVAQDDPSPEEAYYVAINSEFNLAAPGVLTNDYDVDINCQTVTLSALLTQGPAHGTINWFGNGSFTYRPNLGYVGSDSLQYRAFDGVCLSEPATVRFEVFSGDVNRDGCVNDTDLLLVLFSIGRTADYKVSASGINAQAKVWSVPSGTPLATMIGHTGRVFSTEFSPNGLTLLTGSQDTTFRLWNAESGALLKTVTAHTGQTWDATHSPNGQMIATCSNDQTIKLWDANTGALLRTLTGHTNAVRRVDFSPNGQFLASCSTDRTIKVWRVSDGALIRTLTGHTQAVRSVSYSRDGLLLVSTSDDATTRLWRVSDGALIRTLSMPAGGRSAAFSPNGQWVAAAGDDFILRVWQVSNGALVRTIAGHTGVVREVAFSPDSRYLSSASDDGSVRVWRTSDGSLFKLLQVGSGVDSVSFSSQIDYLIEDLNRDGIVDDADLLLVLFNFGSGC